MPENLSKRLAPYRHLTRRAMAAALALVLCLGMLPVSAFGLETASTLTALPPVEVER
ncbi:MAG: hypothetical protein RR216_06780 [Pseudoflavonifractor sp.]